MVFGGVPYYLEQLKKGKSIDQNIDELLFNEDSILFNEFNNLYASLFIDHEVYVEIIKALASKNKGLSRNEIVPLISKKSGGSLTIILEDLELSGFIRKYYAIDKKQRNALYQLMDSYSLFYFNFLNHRNIQKNQWLQLLGNVKTNAWSGYAFEMVCLWHVDAIKKSLGIEGVQTDVYSWSNNNAQIDLLLDRKDQIINVFEIKFSEASYSISSKYVLALLNKIDSFKKQTKTRKAVFLYFISTYGLIDNQNKGMVQNELTMDHLF